MKTPALTALSLAILLATPQVQGANLTIPTSGRVSVELIFSDAAFSNTLSVASPAVTVALTGCQLEPAVGLTGVPLLSEKRSQRGCRVELDSDGGTPGTQGFPANTTFEFRFCSQTDADADCEFVWSSDPTRNSDNFDHVNTTALFTATFPGQIFRLDWEDLPDGGDLDFNDLVAVVRVQSDTDGDGLWDDWEQFGIDTNGDGVVDLDLPALGADPQRQDIFLEVDYLDCTVAGGDCAMGDTHSHMPKAAATQAVIDALANAPVTNPDGSTGITLHLDVDDAIPHQNFVSIGCTFSSAAYDAIKADPAFFGTGNPRRFAYHYAIFAHRQDSSTSSSGCGERPGNDFVVTLGEWNSACVRDGPDDTLDTVAAGDDVTIGTSFITAGPNLTCETTAAGDDTQIVANGSSPTSDIDGDGLDDRTVGTVQQQAGTLMHEFGHNLNLRHGGGDIDNYKPNYISIMNYAFQTRGIRPTDPDGTGPLVGRADYSAEDLADLDENDLDETAGIGDGTDNTRYSCPTGTLSTGAGTGPIDWDCDGDGGANTSVFVNINARDGAGLTILSGFDDWDNLKLDFQNSGDFDDGMHDSVVDLVEMDLAAHLDIPAGVSIDIKPFSDPNAINTRKRGLVAVAICNGGAVHSSVDIDDPTDPFGYSNASTNMDVDAVEFAFARDGSPYGLAISEHILADPFTLGEHLTKFVDSNFDGVPDTLVPLDAPNCAGDPAGPDLVVHFDARDTGLAPGVAEACVRGRLLDSSEIVGCDSVLIVR